MFHRAIKKLKVANKLRDVFACMLLDLLCILCLRCWGLRLSTLH